MELIIWLGIVICISQSAIFSGLNLAFFSVSKLRLEIETANDNKAAIKVAKMRKDSNFLLTTILWGNVGINVLLTLLSNSVMAGIIAFVFSTFVITFLGEIIPQAYFSRHALKMASLLSPVLRFYQILLFLVAKPTALALDRWLGDESILFFQENDLKELLRLHSISPETDIDRVESTGALNFLDLDDLTITEVSVPIHPASILKLEFKNGIPVFPPISNNSSDPFLKKIQASGKKWVILTDEKNDPKMTLDADAFLRTALFSDRQVNPLFFSHVPIIIRDPQYTLDNAISKLKVYPERVGDDVIDYDIILFWSEEEKRVVTGSDVLGRLLRGISRQVLLSKYR